MSGDKLQNALQEIVEEVHEKREQLTDAIQSLKEALQELKLQRVVKSVYNAVLAGMDIFILTPVRCIQTATRSGQGIFTLLLNPLVLYLTFGLAGVFALFLVLAEFYKLWRDRKHSDPTYICSRLIANADEFETPILEQEVQNYLAQHSEELKGVVAQVAPDYVLKYVGNAKIGYLNLEKAEPIPTPSKTDGASGVESKSAANSQPKSTAEKKYPQTALDKLAGWGAKLKHSRIGKIFWPFWKALLQYSYGYWVVFALALFCGHFAAAGVAFSLGIAFGVPAVIPALYLLFRAGRWVWRQCYGTKDTVTSKEQESITAKVDLKAARLKVLKAFVLRKLGETEVIHFEQQLGLLLENEAANKKLPWQAKRSNLEQQLLDRNSFDFSQTDVDRKTDFDHERVNQRKAELVNSLKGNETTRKWLGGVFNFANGYMFGFFAMWPILDIICWLATGATIFILPAPVMWGLLAFYLTVGAIYAVHGVYKAREDYRKHAEKVDEVAESKENGPPSKLEQIAFLQLKLKNLKADYKALYDKLKLNVKTIPKKLYLPEHEDMDCIKRTSHRHHSMTVLELAGDFIKFVLQQGGTGAFLIRSVITLGPILLFIGPDPILYFGSLALASCIVIAALTWTAIKFYEYYKNQQYAKGEEFINNLDISKDMLIHEIVLLETENERLKKLEENLPAPETKESRSPFDLFNCWIRRSTPANPTVEESQLVNAR